MRHTPPSVGRRRRPAEQPSSAGHDTNHHNHSAHPCPGCHPPPPRRGQYASPFTSYSRPEPRTDTIEADRGEGADDESDSSEDGDIGMAELAREEITVARVPAAPRDNPEQRIQRRAQQHYVPELLAERPVSAEVSPVDRGSGREGESLDDEDGRRGEEPNQEGPGSIESDHEGFADDEMDNDSDSFYLPNESSGDDAPDSGGAGSMESDHQDFADDEMVNDSDGVHFANESSGDDESDSGGPGSMESDHEEDAADENIENAESDSNRSDNEDLEDEDLEDENIDNAEPDSNRSDDEDLEDEDLEDEDLEDEDLQDEDLEFDDTDSNDPVGHDLEEEGGAEDLDNVWWRNTWEIPAASSLAAAWAQRQEDNSPPEHRRSPEEIHEELERTYGRFEPQVLGVGRENNNPALREVAPPPRSPEGAQHRENHDQPEDRRSSEEIHEEFERFFGRFEPQMAGVEGEGDSPAPEQAPPFPPFYEEQGPGQGQAHGLEREQERDQSPERVLSFQTSMALSSDQPVEPPPPYEGPPTYTVEPLREPLPFVGPEPPRAQHPAPRVTARLRRRRQKVSKGPRSPRGEPATTHAVLRARARASVRDLESTTQFEMDRPPPAPRAALLRDLLRDLTRALAAEAARADELGVRADWLETRAGWLGWARMVLARDARIWCRAVFVSSEARRAEREATVRAVDSLERLRAEHDVLADVNRRLTAQVRGYEAGHAAARRQIAELAEINVSLTDQRSLQARLLRDHTRDARLLREEIQAMHQLMPSAREQRASLRRNRQLAEEVEELRRSNAALSERSDRLSGENRMLRRTNRRRD